MTRRHILFFVALMTLLGALVAAIASTAQRNFDLRGYVDPTQDQNLPLMRDSQRLGVNVELTQYTTDELSLQLEQMENAHVKYVRQFFYWDEIETEKGVLNWQDVNPIVESFQAFPHLKLVAVLMNSPEWARAEGLTQTAAPEKVTDFAVFIQAFAERYGDTIDYYQIWDEPNLTAAWGLTEPRVSQYASLLQAAHEAIHNVDTGATVIAAALAPTTETGPKNISDLIYLGDLYALGAKDYMDAVAGKPYGFGSPPGDRRVEADILNFSRIVALREIMVENSDSNKPLWASNWGWNSLPSSWTGQSSIWGQVSSEQQIQYTLDALSRVEREWPYVHGLVLHHWQPDAMPDDPIWGFALINQAGEPTSLLNTLQQRQMLNTAQNGLYRADNPYAQYSGVWRFRELGADIGWVNNSRLDFNFIGQDIALLLRQDEYVAYLYPSIDGQPANLPPKDAAGNPYILLTSDTDEPQISLVQVSNGLSAGQHTLHIVTDELVPDDSVNRWALIGYAVSSGDLSEPYNSQINVAWLTTFFAFVALVVTAREIVWGKVFTPLAGLWQRLGDFGQLAISAITSAALMIGMLLTWNDAPPTLFRREPVQLGLAILTAGVIYLEPGLLLTLIALAALFVIVYHRLDLGLTLTIFFAPFFLFPVDLYTFAFPMSEILILVTAVAWLLRTIVMWGRTRQAANSRFPSHNVFAELTRLDLGVGAWVMLGVVSLTWAAYRGEAITELRVMIIEPALFYLVARTITLDRRALLRLVDSLLIAGLIVSLIGFWLYIQGEATITAEEGVRRLASVYGSPNNVGLYLGRCLPFALALVLTKTDTTRRILAVIVLLATSLAIILSLSAGALFIGVPAGVAAVIMLIWGRRAILPLAGLAVAGVAAFLVALRSARFARLLDFSSGTNFARVRVWQSAINAVQDYPFTGLGLDQFLYFFRGQYILPDAWKEPNLSHPHNIILDFWLRLGILGVIVLIWIQAAFWQAIYRAYHYYRDHDPMFFAIAVGTMGSMVNLLTHGLVDNSVYVNDLAFVFVLLLVLASTLSNTRAIDEPTRKVV
jgi:O-antigen ligase